MPSSTGRRRVYVDLPTGLAVCKPGQPPMVLSREQMVDLVTRHGSASAASRHLGVSSARFTAALVRLDIPWRKWSRAGATGVERIKELAEAGHSQTDIAAHVGVTRERVRQLLHRYDLYETWEKATTARRQKTREDKMRAEEEAFFRGEPVSPETRARLGYLRPTASRPRASRWSDEEVLWCIKAAASDPDNQPLTGPKYEKYRRSQVLDDGRAWPSNQQAMLRFGTWRQALARAGVEGAKWHRDSYSRRWSDDDIVSALETYAREEIEKGRNPTVHGYGTWQEGHPGEGYPSLSTVRTRGANLVEAFNRVKHEYRRVVA